MAQALLEKFRADTAAIVMKIAFAAGLVAALGGVRALQILFDATDLAGPQRFIFDLIDVLLTAGLIAAAARESTRFWRCSPRIWRRNEKTRGNEDPPIPVASHGP